MVKEYKMEITKNDGSVVGDFRIGVIDGNWTVSYVFEPSMDMTFLACIKHDLDDGDILAHFGNFYFGWYGVNEVKNYSKEFILEKYSDEIFNEDVGDEKSVVENDSEKSIVDESNETLGDEEYAGKIMQLVDDGDISYALVLLENSGWLLTDFEDVLSTMGIKDTYSGKIDEYIDKKSIVGDDKKEEKMDATLDDIVRLIVTGKTKKALKIIEDDSWEMCDINNELYSRSLYKYLCDVEKLIAKNHIKNMLHKIKHGVDYGFIAFDSTEFWHDGVHVAQMYSHAEIPFKRSFDEYDSEWYEENKSDFIAWLKALKKSLK